MNEMAATFAWLLLGVPVLFATVVLFIRDEKVARTVALAGAIAEVAMTIVALFTTREVELAGTASGFGLDGIARVLFPVSAIAALATIVGGPKVFMTRQRYAASLLTLGAAAGLHCARGLDTFVVMWLVSLLPGYLYLDDDARNGTRRVKRIYTAYLLFGAIPLIGASLILHAVTVRPAGDPLLFSNAEAWAPPVHQGIVCALLAVTAMARAAVFPLHSWLPVVMDRAPTLGWQLVGCRASSLLILRLMVPSMSGTASFVLPLLAAAGLLGAVYAGLAAIVQKDLKRLIGYVSVSQSGLIIVGLASMNEQSVVGALLWCVAFPLSAIGMLFIAWALEARLGAVPSEKLGGLVARAPVMTAFFLFFALASSAAPGTIGFVAEDLLIHGMLETKPWLVTLMLLAAVFNAVALFRGFSAVFIGRYRGRVRTEGVPQMRDLLPHERGIGLILAAALLAAGLFPRSIVVSHDSEVRRVLDAASHPGVALLENDHLRRSLSRR
jgi:NADH-quinone oxidoreductase subunit M